MAQESPNDRVEGAPEYGPDGRITGKSYNREFLSLQEDLVDLQKWIKQEGLRVAVIFEGRDAAGKGGTIKRFVEYLMPKYLRVVELGVPTKNESRNWFRRYEKQMPQKGEIVFFDRSWYNRALIEPTMGYCTERQYRNFMKRVVPWEEQLIADGLTPIRRWGEPSDVGKAVVALAHDYFPFTTGEVFNVDGGFNVRKL